MPVLIAYFAGSEQTFPLPEGKPFFIGRDAGCDVVLASPGASARHAVIVVKNGICGVKDLDSTNGTFLNGNRIQSPCALRDGDVICIAETELRFSVADSPSLQDGIDTKSAAGNAPAEQASDSDALLSWNDPGITDDELASSFAANTAAARGYELPTDIAPFPITETLSRIMARRLELYDQLEDVAEERRLLRLSQKELPREVETELLRQSLELDRLPTAEEAEERLNDLDLQREELADAVHRSEKYGREPPPQKSPEMLKAEELAARQWRLCRDFNRETLPLVVMEAYRSVADEPLAADLTSADIYHADLFGGAGYLLALRRLFDETKAQRKQTTRRIRRLSQTEEEEGVLIRLGKAAGGMGARGQKRGEVDSLVEKDRATGKRLTLLNREMTFMERLLLEEFWRVYEETAVRFVRDGAGMPLAVRAFLRYGAIGFQPWWMRAEIKRQIWNDCENNVFARLPVGLKLTSVVYADEFLLGVAEKECPPSPLSSVEAPEKGSPEWKAERAWRKMTSARSYSRLMWELLASLDERGKNFEHEFKAYEEKIRYYESRPYASKDELYELMKEQQGLVIRQSNQEQYIKRIERDATEILAEAEAAERRFTGEGLPVPSLESLIRHECASMREVARNHAGRKERFVPLVIREDVPLDREMIGDRAVVLDKLADIEELDPGLFQKTLISAKKKVSRVDMRFSPVIVLFPYLGVSGQCLAPRDGMVSGLLCAPVFCLPGMNRGRLLMQLVADYRWESSKREAGLDLMASDTLVGAFMKVRWDWRGFPKAKREKGLVHSNRTDNVNWRRIYELYLEDAKEGGRRLYQRNPDMYHALIDKFIELPKGVRPIQK